MESGCHIGAATFCISDALTREIFRVFDETGMLRVQDLPVGAKEYHCLPSFTRRLLPHIKEMNKYRDVSFLYEDMECVFPQGRKYDIIDMA